MRGGHARSGPPPDPDALRRDRPDDAAKWTELPAAGRSEPAPGWPLETEPSTWERGQWEQLWRRPQAVAWERAGDEVAVATYVRTAAEAGENGAPAAVRNAFLRMRDALGLTVLGMRANRWRLVGDRPAVAPSGTRKRSTGSSRDRFTVVQGGA